MVDGVCTNWLKETHPFIWEHRMSRGLRDYSTHLATLVSYETSEKLVGERIGNDKISDQGIMELVLDHAEELASEQLTQIADCQSSGYSCIAEPVDIYDVDSEELIFMSDGVCVNEQKAKRDKVAKSGKERLTINVYQLQANDSEKSSYKTIIAAEGVSENDLILSECMLSFGFERKKLPIVAISDGARSIKNQNKVLFGQALTHILD